MKTLRSLLMAMALLMMLAIPAMAQEYSGTIALNCFGDPETVTVTNTGPTPFIVDSVTSLDDPRDNEPFDVSVELEAGESVVFETGETAGDGALTNQFIFDNEAADEGVEIVINTEGGSATAGATCEEGRGAFGGGPGAGPIVEPKVPDNQQTDGKGATVTKTFELTLDGTVPDDRAFGVAYGTFDEFEGDEATDVIFCGQPDPQIGDVVVSDEDCVGDGETYTYSVELPEGTELYFTYITAVEGDEENTAEFFFGNITFEGPGEAEVLNTDFTNTAWYTFGGGAGDDKQDDTQDDVQDDLQGEMPGEMPDTGAGGLVAGASIPVGNAAAGLTVLLSAGYAVIRRR